MRRYQAGESANALALEFGVPRTSAVGALLANGVDVRYRILTGADVAAARALYESGLSLAAVGERFGVMPRTALNAFRKAGVRLDRSGRTSGRDE